MIFRFQKQHRAGERGFTMVELLTVIAIIAILAALLFPVMAKARDQARQSGCMTNIHTMIQALKMYKDDWRVYPDALYGIQYSGGPYQNRLYPNYVKDRKTFNCPNSPVRLPQDPNPSGTTVTVPPLVTPVNRMPGTAALNYGVAQFSSYDFQYRNDASYGNTSGIAELHYTKKWTTTMLSLSDDPRQLVYREPPDATVVTWCLYHSSPDAAGNPAPNSLAVVGFLSGRVQTIPAAATSNWPPPGPGVVYPWQVQPKD